MKDGAGARRSAMLALEQEPELDADLVAREHRPRGARLRGCGALARGALGPRRSRFLDKLGSAEEFAAFVASEHYERLRAATKAPE